MHGFRKGSEFFMFLALLAGIAFAGGCAQENGNNTTSASSKQQGAESQTIPASQFGKAPSDDECLAFARAYEQALVEQDVEAVSSMFDWDAMLKIATANTDASEKFRQNFITGAKRGTKQGGLPEVLVNLIRQGGSIRLLHVHKVGEGKRVLFRVLLSSGGVNYHDMVVIERPSGKVLAINLYAFASGEMVSQSTRRMFLAAAAHDSRSFLQKLVKSDKEYIKHIDKYGQMMQCVQTGKCKQALAIYDKLPESIREEKTAMWAYLMAAQQVDEKRYLQAIGAFRKAYPNDACLDMVLIDHYLLQGKYDRALKCIEALDKAVGGDPYLNVMRANIYVERKDLANARRLAEQTIEEAPDIVDGYWVLINVTLAERNFGDTAKWLTKIGEEFAIEFEDLTTIPEYAEFVKSPEYQKWMQSRGTP